MKGLACRRFSRLLNELADREATPREERFLEAHRNACADCRREEQASFMTLDLLRCSSIDTEPAQGFDRRVLRRARVAQVQAGVRYWSPALLGGAVAAAVVLAAVQALTKPIAPGSISGTEAHRTPTTSLALSHIPKRLQ